jgi:nucleoid-associated protein YejK
MEQNATNQKQSKYTPVGEYKWYQETSISFGRNKRDEMETQNMKRNRLLRKYKIEKEENLNQVTEELKQKVSSKTQRFFRYRKNKTITIKIKCLQQNARNFTAFSDRKILM